MPTAAGLEDKAERRSFSSAAQKAPQHLAGRTERQFISELDATGHLVGHQSVSAETEKLRLTDPTAMLLIEHDKGLHRLAPIGIVDADHSHHLDGRMSVDDLFDLARPNLEAGGVDLVLQAVDAE